jgi:esterase/lipase
MKTLIDIYKNLAKLGIKPKDIIGIGGNIKKFGKSLFNHPIGTDMLRWIRQNDKLPNKVIEQIKIHARSLKNANDKDLVIFNENIKRIITAKNPPSADIVKLPVSRIKRPETKIDESDLPPPGSRGEPDDIAAPFQDAETTIANITSQMSKIKNTSSKLEKAIKEYENIYKPKGAEVDKWMKAIADKEKQMNFQTSDVKNIDVAKILFNETNEFAAAKGEARLILNKMEKDGLISGVIDKLNKGADPLLMFQNTFGNKALLNLPNQGSVQSAEYYAKFLKNARDAKGLRVDDPNFNRETLDLSKLNLDDIDMVPPYARGGIADHFRSR